MDFSSDLCEFIFENASEGIFQSTPQGRFLRVNPAMANMYGYASPKDMVDSVADISKQLYVSPEYRAVFIEMLEKNGFVENFEAQDCRKDGSVICTSTNARAIRDSDGRVMYYLGFVQNITAHKQTKVALGESEARYRTLVEQVPAAVYIEAPTDNLNEDVYISPQIESISGYTPTEWTSTREFWSSVIHPDDLEQFRQEDKRTNETGAPFDMEYRILHKDGRFVWIRDMAALTHDAAGKALFWHGILIDTSEQKKFQETLRSSEDRFRKVFEASPVAICITALENGEFLDANEAYLRLSNFRREDILGRYATDIGILTKEERQTWLEQFLASGKSLHKKESIFRTASGKTLTTLAFYEGIEINGKQAILSMFYDTSSQAKVTEALRESEARYRALVDNIPAAVFLDPAGGSEETIYINSQIENILGYTAREWITDPKLWERCIHPADFERVLLEHQRTDQTGQRFSVEYRMIAKSGRVVWIHEESTLVRDETGAPMFWQGVLLDITTRKESQDALQEIASSYRGLFDSVSDAVYIQDREGRFLDVNQGAVKMYGYPREYFIGKKPDFISAPGRNNLAEVGKALELAFGGMPQQFEFWGLRTNGEIFPKDVRLTKGTFFGQEVVFALAQDITEKKKTGEALRRRDAILESITYASEIFLKAENWREYLPDIISRIGQAGETSRVYIFQNKVSPEGQLLADQIFEWCAPGIPSQLNNPNLHNMNYQADGFDLWEKSLGQGHVICDLVKNLPFKAQEELGREGIKSLLNVPIFAGSLWWGFIGYDECTYDRQWYQPEIEALRTAASILGAVIESANVEEALKKSEEQYRTLIEQASDGIYVADVTGKCIDVNPSGCILLGYTREEALRLNLLDVIDKNDLARRPRMFRRIRRGQSITTEIHLNRKDGSRIPVDVSIKKLMDGRWQGIVRDITERRKASESLERQLKELSILHEIAATSTHIRDEDELIEAATDIIGNTLYSDILGFLLITETGDNLYPHPSYRGITVSDEVREYSINEGVSGQVARTGISLNIRDVREVGNFISINPASRSELCVPMIVGDRVIGLINAESSKIGYFTSDDERLLLTIAGQLATTIERLRSEKAEREQRALAEALRDIAAALNNTLEFNTVMDRILENLGRVVPCKSANIMLLENNILRIVRYRGYTDEVMNAWQDQFAIDINELPDILQASQTGHPQIVPNTQKDSRWVTFDATRWIRSHLTAPIIEGNKVIGFINLDHDTADFFTSRDLDRMTAFASLAATAIENARLFQEESRRAKIIEALAEIANVIAATRDIDSAFDKIAERTLTLLGASHVAIYLLQEDNKTLKIVTAKGQYRERLLSHTIKVGIGITGHIVASGKAEIINNMMEDPRRSHVPGTPDDDSLKETMMSAPLILRGTAIGAINVWRLRSNSLFEQSELNFLVSIAHQASIAIESGRLFEETDRHAQQTAAIAEVGRDISSTLQLDVVLERIAAYARDLLRSETTAVYLATPNTSELRAIAALGKEAAEIMSDPLQLGTGILGNIALQKKGEIINDTVNDPRAITVKGTDTDPFEHLMGVPVLHQDTLTGLVAVWRSGDGREYKPTDLGFLTGLAQQAAIAIENARLFQAEQQRRQEAETLREATAVVATTLDRGQAIDLILEQLTRVLDYDSASVQLLHEGYLEIVGGRGWPAEASILGLRFPVPGDNPNTTVILSQKPLMLNNAREANRHFREAPHEHIRSWLGIPLIAHGKVIGMLAVDSAEQDHFNEEHVRLATAFANQASIAIENARLHEQSEAQIQRLTALRDVDTAIASSLDLRVTLNILMDHAMTQLKTHALSILIYNHGMQSLENITSVGFHSSRVTRGLLHIGEGFGGKVALSRKPIQVLDLQGTPEYERYRWLSDERFVSYVGFPLVGKGQIKGVLEAYFRETFSPSPEWLEFMQTLAGQAAIAIDNSQLFENLQRINQELMLAYDTTLEGWGKALELRDKETQGHTRRVTELTLKLARRMGLSDTEITHIHRGVLLHDIGKMGVPDHILRKTGPLSETEWSMMRLHPQYAYDLLQPIAYLRPALDIPYCHHERWDGNGYPRGLKGEEIPLPARIFAVIDVWDALQSDRPYRKPWSRNKTIEYIHKEAGTRFDPRIVDVFLRMVSETV